MLFDIDRQTIRDLDLFDDRSKTKIRIFYLQPDCYKKAAMKC